MYLHWSQKFCHSYQKDDKNDNYTLLFTNLINNSIRNYSKLSYIGLFRKNLGQEY
jgi:hypothetical protein